MACELRTKPETRAQALARLAAQLKAGTARVMAGRITGWTGDRAGMCDGCALSAIRRQYPALAGKVGPVEHRHGTLTHTH